MVYKLVMTTMHFVSVRELHREFLHSGADVMQALTFYASDDKLRTAHITYTVRYMPSTAVD